jgi:hypothetical protein
MKKDSKRHFQLVSILVIPYKRISFRKTKRTIFFLFLRVRISFFGQLIANWAETQLQSRLGKVPLVFPLLLKNSFLLTSD